MELARQEGWTAPGGEPETQPAPDAAGESVEGLASGQRGSTDTPSNAPDELPGGRDPQAKGE